MRKGRKSKDADPDGVFVKLSPKMREHLEDLLDGGLHGDSIAEVATRLLARQMEGPPQAGNGSGRAIGFKQDKPRRRRWPPRTTTKGEG